MFTGILILLLLIIAGIAAFYYYRSQQKQPGYVNDSINLRTTYSERETREMNEAQEIIHCVKTRRESVGRRSSFEEASGEFINLRHVKLARAVSCDSVVSETSETENWETNENGFNERKIEIPDIKAWLKNPTDFIKFPTGKPSDENASESKATRDETQPDSESKLAQIMISMSYLPTAERLSVVIVRVRIPRVITTDEDESNVCVPKMIYVKAYLVDEETGKRAYKKKTSLKQFEQSTGNYTIINFNELMIFKLPINKLSKTAVRVSVTGLGLDGVVAQPDTDETRITSIGFVILGCSSPTSSGVSHFSTMMNTMRKPITMWHILQR